MEKNKKTKRLSIVTINLNNKNGLERTIKSVVDQTFRDFEYIIIDGKSEDGSIEIIQQYETHIKYWESENDSGIYRAMNKGVHAATGKYCLFLNSGDYLAKNTILSEVFNEDYDEDIFYGNILIQKGNRLVPGSSVPKVLTLEFLLHQSLAHQATFFKRSIIISQGGFNENYLIISDWELILNTIVFKGAKYKYIPYYISVYDTNGLSSKPENIALIRAEGKKAVTKYFPEIVIRQLEDNYKEVSEFRNFKKKFLYKLLSRFIP